MSIKAKILLDIIFTSVFILQVKMSNCLINNLFKFNFNSSKRAQNNPLTAKSNSQISFKGKSLEHDTFLKFCSKPEDTVASRQEELSDLRAPEGLVSEICALDDEKFREDAKDKSL